MSFLDEIQLEDEFSPCKVFQEAFGFIPNLIRAQSLLPRLIDAQAKLEGAVRLREGAISRAQKERILLTIAVDRRDTYGVAMHAKVLSSLGAPDGQVNDLLSDYRNADLRAPDLASLQFCLKLSRNALGTCSEDIEALRARGLVDEAIFETAIVTALAAYCCTLSVGLGPEPDFRPPALASSRIGSQADRSPAGFLPDIHGKPRDKGPYVPAPYLSSNAFAPFAILQQTHGFIPNFFRAQTLRPDLLEAELQAMQRILLPGDVLSRVQKECILLAVSAANLNSYCVAMHCNLLRGLGLPAEESDQVAADHHQSALSDADKALLDFAIKLGTHFSEFSRDDIVALRAIGFTDEQILECEAVTALNNFANTLQMGLGFEPDFEPPLAFQQNKVNLSAATNSPMAGDPSISALAIAIEDPDAGLVTKAQAGNLEAFENLVRRHSQAIYRTLTAILGDPVEAQDAMQDTLLSAFKHIRDFQGRSKFSTWLVSIARNAALQRLRGRKNEESLDQSAFQEDRDFRPRQVRAWQDNPEQCHSKSEMRHLVEKGLLQLPAKYRVVVMLRDIEQLSADEVARQLGLGIPAVKTRLLRGRLMLREWLSPHFTTGVRSTAQ